MTAPDGMAAEVVLRVDIHDPVAVETAIATINARLHNSVEVIGKLNDETRTLSREYAKAKAVAYLSAEGPQPDRRAAAELASMDLREELDASRVGLDYARDYVRALEKELSGLQSILSDLRVMYNAERGRD